jgi:excisionase family DNA binding protein
MSPRATKDDKKLVPVIVAQLLSPSAAASILGISSKTIHKLVREGKLPCVQVTARERRFTPGQVQELFPQTQGFTLLRKGHDGRVGTFLRKPF